MLKMKEKPFKPWTCHRIGSIWILVAQETLFKSKEVPGSFEDCGVGGFCY